MDRQPLVLIVDDDQDTCDMYAAFLTTDGFGVRTAQNGADGFKRACETRPDVIVTDLALPRVDGWELVRRVKADRRTCRTPVVVLSGRPEPSHAERARRAECAAFLMKPCLPDTLASELRRILVSQFERRLDRHPAAKRQ